MRLLIAGGVVGVARLAAEVVDGHALLADGKLGNVPSVPGFTPGIFLALGETLGGHPAIGVWLSSALACAALVWMLEAWISPSWALLGGFIVVVQYGVFETNRGQTGRTPFSESAHSTKLGNVPSGSCEEIVFRANNAIAKLGKVGKLRM